MKFSADKNERYTLLKLQEENLNSVVAPALKSEFILLSNEGRKNLIVDLSEVAYMDSSGLSTLLTGNRLATQSGGTFIILGQMSKPVKTLFQISRLDSVLTIIPTEQEAIDYLAMQELEQELKGEDGE